MWGSSRGAGLRNPCCCNRGCSTPCRVRVDESTVHKAQAVQCGSGLPIHICKLQRAVRTVSPKVCRCYRSWPSLAAASQGPLVPRVPTATCVSTRRGPRATAATGLGGASTHRGQRAPRAKAISLEIGEVQILFSLSSGPPPAERADSSRGGGREGTSQWEANTALVRKIGWTS